MWHHERKQSAYIGQENDIVKRRSLAYNGNSGSRRALRRAVVA